MRDEARPAKIFCSERIDPRRAAALVSIMRLRQLSVEKGS
jgi:hypothetical protein